MSEAALASALLKLCTSKFKTKAQLAGDVLIVDSLCHLSETEELAVRQALG